MKRQFKIYNIKIFNIKIYDIKVYNKKIFDVNIRTRQKKKQEKNIYRKKEK